MRTALPTLATERLILRQLAPEDMDDVFAYASNPEVSRHLTWECHRSLADTLVFLRAVDEAYERGELRDFGLVLKATGRLVGTCGFVRADRAAGLAELGYTLARPLWDRGLMTEAVRAVIDFGLEEIGLRRVEALCLPENAASARVLEKAGMTREGLVEGRVVMRGQPRAAYLFSLSVEERRARERVPSAG